MSVPQEGRLPVKSVLWRGEVGAKEALKTCISQSMGWMAAQFSPGGQQITEAPPLKGTHVSVELQQKFDGMPWPQAAKPVGQEVESRGMRSISCAGCQAWENAMTNGLLDGTRHRTVSLRNLGEAIVGAGRYSE